MSAAFWTKRGRIVFHSPLPKRCASVGRPLTTRSEQSKARMGATHFLDQTLPKVATEMALSVLAHNLTRVMNIIEVRPLTAAIAV